MLLCPNSSSRPCLLCWVRWLYQRWPGHHYHTHHPLDSKVLFFKPCREFFHSLKVMIGMLKPWLRPQVKEQRSHGRFSIGFYTGWLLFIHCWPSERLRQFHRARIVHLLFTAYSFARVEVKLCTWGFSLCVSGECSAELWYCVVDVRLNSSVTNLPQSFNSLCLWSFI